MPDPTPQPSITPGPNIVAMAIAAGMWLWTRPDWSMTFTRHDVLLILAGVILTSHLSGNDWSQLLKLLPGRKDAE